MPRLRECRHRDPAYIPRLSSIALLPNIKTLMDFSWRRPFHILRLTLLSRSDSRTGIEFSRTRVSPEFRNILSGVATRARQLPSRLPTTYNTTRRWVESEDTGVTVKTCSRLTIASMKLMLSSATLACAQEHKSGHWGYEGEDGPSHRGDLNSGLCSVQERAPSVAD
jgi:hypothetical protein